MDEQTCSSLIISSSYTQIKQRMSEKAFFVCFCRLCLKYLGDIPCHNCNSFEKSVNLLKSKLMSKKDCDYVLKSKYDGVYGYFNKDMTNVRAKKLIKVHPKGEDLFIKLPTNDNTSRDTSEEGAE